MELKIGRRAKALTPIKSVTGLWGAAPLTPIKSVDSMGRIPKVSQGVPPIEDHRHKWGRV
jgi:hypothetical protein